MSKFTRRWNIAGAAFGGAGWLASIGISLCGRLSLETHQKLFLLAPWVIVPLGFELSARLRSDFEPDWALRIARLVQPFGAAAASASFFLFPGRSAGLLAACWLLVTCWAGLAGFATILRRGFFSLEAVCLNVALLYLPVGGGGLALSRMGASPMGFKEPIVLLTAVHFHFSGFAAPILAAALGKALGNSAGLRRAVFRAVALSVISSPALVALGFVVSPALKALAALLLTLSLVGFSVLALEILPAICKGVGRTLVAVSALSIIAGMSLVCVYVAGDFLGQEFISIPGMALFHGTINAIGFALCGLVGWTLAFSKAGLELQARSPRQVLGQADTAPKRGSAL